MVKDGSGWGAMVGLSAAFLAQDGFTGAPALTVEQEDSAAIWSDLGVRWRILEQYFKAYPVCRWAQPAIEAALALQRTHNLDAAQIDQVTVYTFHEGTRLATRCPQSSDEAQYSLPFPVAAALVRGQVSASEVSGGALSDPDILRLSQSTALVEDAGYNALFPAERWAHVTFTLKDGAQFTSTPAVARGNPENPLSDAELEAKYYTLSKPILGHERAEKLYAGVMQDASRLHDLLTLLLNAP